MAEAQGPDALERLRAVIADRAGGDSATSYTAKLLNKGPAHIAKKLGEEAVEVVIAAVEGQPAAVISESADLLYHWMTLLQALAINPQDVYAELDRRHGQSGLTEKANRPRD